MHIPGLERLFGGSVPGEEKYVAAFHASPDSITITRLSDGEILEGNEGFERLLGYSRGECIGKTTADLAMWADSADRDSLARRLRETGEVRDFETTLRRKDGTLVAVTVSARILVLDGEECFLAVVRDTTERKRAERALRDSEEKFRTLFEQSVVAKSMTRPSGEIQVNRAFCDMLGCTPQELTDAATWQQVTYPDDIPATERTMASILTGEIQSARFEKRYVRKDGSIVWADVSSSLHRDAAGEPEYFMTTIVDITERKRAEAQGEMNSRRVQALLELNQMAGSSRQEISDFALEEAVRVTASTIGYLAFLDEDETTLTMYSWSRSAMAECAIADKPIEYPVETTGLWGEAVRQRKPVVTNDYTADNPLKKGYPAGHVALQRHLCVPVFDGSRIVAVAGVGNKPDEYDEDDIRQLTLLMEGMWQLLERRRIDDALHENQARLDLALRSAEMGVWSFDIVENRRVFDRQACCLLGIDPATFTGTAEEFFAAMHPEDVEEITVALSRTIDHDAPFEPEYRAVWPDGSEHWIAARGSLFRDHQGRPARINGILWDISERKQVEQGVQELARSLEERVIERTRELDETIGQLTEANEAKTRFLRSMSHELRTPLNSIIGFTGVMQQGLAGPTTEEQTRQLAMIRNSGRHLLALINDILDLSRIDAGAVEVHPEPIDVRGLLADLASECGASADSKGLALTVELSDPAPWLSSDPVKLRQILLNLLSNAIKFTDAGGVVLRALVPSSHVVEFSVSDTGPGIAVEEWDHIFGEFERGFRQDPTVEGTGLGLAISRGLAGSLGGTLGVKSKVGKGSTFTLTLPESQRSDKEQALKDRA
jgi:two-component system sensor histidine kinase/response regulator